MGDNIFFWLGVNIYSNNFLKLYTNKILKYDYEHKVSFLGTHYDKFQNHFSSMIQISRLSFKNFFGKFVCKNLFGKICLKKFVWRNLFGKISWISTAIYPIKSLFKIIQK